MSSEQNKPLTIGLCSEPGTGKTQFVYQFLSDVLALNAQSGASEGLDDDAKKYYQKLSAETEKGGLPPTRDEKSFSVSLSDKVEASPDVKLRQYNFYDESGDSFVNYVEDDEKSDDIFNQLINNSDVLIYTINPASPEFASETYSQTLQEHIHQLLKTIAKKRGNRYLPVYFLFTHQNDLDSLSEDDRAAIQKQMDSLMAFVKQEYQNRYNRTFPKDLASPKTAFGTFDLKQPGSALQVMEETLNLHNCLEKFDRKFRARSRIVLIPFAIILIGLAIAILSWVLPKLTGANGDSLEGIERRVSKLEKQWKDFSEKIDEFEKKIGNFNSNDINLRLKTLENTVKNLSSYGSQIESINQTLVKLEGDVKNIPDYKDRIDGIDQTLRKHENDISIIPTLSSRITGIDGQLVNLENKSRNYGAQFDDINNNYKTLERKVNNIPNYGNQIKDIEETLDKHENRISAIEKKPNASPANVPASSGEEPKEGFGQQIKDINTRLDTLKNDVINIPKYGTQIEGINQTLDKHESRLSAIEKQSSASPANVPAPSEDKTTEDNYGTQIEGLNKRLGTLENNVNNIPNYDQQITDIKEQIKDLQGKVNTPSSESEPKVDYSKQIQEFNNRIKELESKLGTGGNQTQSPPKNTAIDGKDQYGKYKKITYKGLTFVFRYCEPCKNGFPMGENGITVKLNSGFWILESEVTNEMWKEITGTCPSDNKGNSFPVDQVTWYECESFCRDLSEKINKTCNTNFKFQLPTEAQWEYACRAGNTLKKVSDEKVIEIISDLAWYNKNSNGIVHAVKTTKKPNNWGIYDMYGNVCELVRDGYDELGKIDVTDPYGLKKSKCVYRGGRYSYSCWYVNWYYRDKIDKNKPYHAYGFRICIEDETDSK